MHLSKILSRLLIKGGIISSDGSADSDKLPILDSTGRLNATVMPTIADGVSGISDDITGLTGGGATNLDGIATAGLTVPLIVTFSVGEVQHSYKLVAGTDAEVSPLVIRPDDYNGVSNQKIWKLQDQTVGNLTVAGTTTTVNSETLTVDDNVIVLNNNITGGVPSEDAGVQVRRGGSTSAALTWNETSDKWTAGLAGTEDGIVLQTAFDTHTADATVHLTGAQNTLLDGLNGTLTSTELNYVDGVTSPIQTQIDTVVTDLATHAADTDLHLSAFQNTLFDGLVGTLTASEFNYLDGLNTNVQGALDNKQPLDPTLTALAGVTTAADKVIYATGSDAFTTTDLSAFGRTLIDDADATTALTTLGAVPTTRTISTSGAATGGGDLSANRTIDVPVATATNVRYGTGGTVVVIPTDSLIKYKNLGGSNEPLVIGDANTALSFGQNSLTIQPARADTSQVALGDFAIAIGANAMAQGSNSVVVGTDAKGIDLSATAFGYNSVSQQQGVCVGSYGYAFADGVSIGATSVAGAAAASSAVAVGFFAQATGSAAIGIGRDSSVPAAGAIAIGASAIASGDYACAFGYAANAAGISCVSIGQGSSAILQGVAVGTSSSTTTNAVAVGPSALGGGVASVAVGLSASANNTNNIAIGYNAVSSATNGATFGANTDLNAEYVSQLGAANSGGAMNAWVQARGANKDIIMSFQTTDTAAFTYAGTADGMGDGSLSANSLRWRVNAAGTSLIVEANVAGVIKTGTVALA